MDESPLDRSIRFAAFLIGGVLLLAFGLEDLVSGAIDLGVQCTTQNFGGDCSGNQIWGLLSPVISGTIIVILAVVFFLLAHRTRRTSEPSIPPPPPPPP